MLATREAIHAAGLITAGVAFGVAAPLAAGDPGWFDKPMRCAQLNSTEDNAAENGHRVLDGLFPVHPR